MMGRVSVLDPQGSIKRALVEIGARGGPELDIEDLAEEAQVPADILVRLDQGRPVQVGVEELERLCRILGRSPNDLLGYESDL
jgi:DNA-binding Xre family transcriptional regulator